MSGGVGPICGDISLPKEQESIHKEAWDPKQGGGSVGRRKAAAFLSLRQLNALAVVIIFSASGMVCAEDLVFVMFSIMYMYFLSRVAFPRIGGAGDAAVFGPENRVLRLYVLFAAMVGLFLPVAYILEGFFEEDKEGIKAASPHVFLLASQVFMEGVAANDSFSTPIRVFVPVFYNSRRIFTLTEWLRNEFAKEDKEYSGSVRRLMVGRALAVANMALWSFNLFGFLLPVYLPRAFKRYYSLYKSKD
ncbi:uncharacterized protein LOC101214743 [Cucumis sativus]|uniref:DUF7733 domain-containing protein n=1 Tax=Cucumis sativus TaxID=3659 RepID=A0A0A0KK26_CUCSA|nr:uncharacterized protein LOC101214743 [Cucumis sativus]KGN49933.1 hypothetical protein Csa_000593 [Cucumis sativus]